MIQITHSIPAVNDNLPIFAKRNGEMMGMLVKESNGWILKTGESYGWSGHHTSALACMRDAVKHSPDIEFFIGGEMKKVDLCPRSLVSLEDVHEDTPIFAKKGGKMAGMVVCEPQKGGWIIKRGGETGAYGHFESREELLYRGEELYGYTFFIEED